MSKVTPKTGVTLARFDKRYIRIYLLAGVEYIYGMCCSYIVLANPNMKLRIKFIIMKIFMKIVKICPKSPRFTVMKNTMKIIVEFIFKGR